MLDFDTLQATYFNKPEIFFAIIFKFIAHILHTLMMKVYERIFLKFNGLAKVAPFLGAASVCAPYCQQEVVCFTVINLFKSQPRLVVKSSTAGHSVVKITNGCLLVGAEADLLVALI